MTVRLRRPQHVRLGRPRDSQIESLGDVLETLEGDVLGTSWEPIFADWDQTVNCDSKKSKFTKHQEAKGLLSKLGIKIPLSKVPILGDILF